MLITAVDIQSIQISLRDCIPHTAQQITGRNAKKPTDKSKTAVSESVKYIVSLDLTQNNIVTYTIDQSFGGAARRPERSFGSKGPNFARVGPHEKPNQNKHKPLNQS